MKQSWGGRDLENEEDHHSRFCQIEHQQGDGTQPPAEGVDKLQPSYLIFMSICNTPTRLFAVKTLGDQMTDSPISPASGEEEFYDEDRLSCLDHIRQKTILLQSR